MVHLLIDGRTTGIEPAHGGFTIHCLDPLGYIRPYPPRPSFCFTVIKPIKQLIYLCILAPNSNEMMPNHSKSLMLVETSPLHFPSLTN